MLTIWTGFVPTDSIGIVEARVERLANRARRQGFPVPSLTAGVSERRDVGGIIKDWTEITIEAEGRLALGNYEFVGTIARLEDGTPFVTYAPGVDRHLDGDWKPEHVNYCDHCKTLRDRNDTYIVRGSDGYHQVGSTCIKDFTGHSASAITGWLSAYEDLSISDEDIEGWSRSATRFYPTTSIISIAARLASRGGYISRAKGEMEGRIPTAQLVRNWLTATGREMREWHEDYPATDDSEKLYNDTMTVLENPDPNNTSDWYNDIVTLVQAGGVQWRHVGIVSSAVILGMRQQERRSVEARPESNYFGEVGERLTMEHVKVMLKRGFEGAYGFSYVLRFDVGGNDAVWFASASNATDELEEGDIITLTATVKKHETDSRSHRPTTILTRGKFEKEN